MKTSFGRDVDDDELYDESGKSWEKGEKKVFHGKKEIRERTYTRKTREGETSEGNRCTEMNMISLICM